MKVKMCWRSRLTKMFNSQVNPHRYPCFCQALETLFYCGRLVGILPIVTENTETHYRVCKFVVSRKWKIYSWILQLIYLAYILITYTDRFTCVYRKSLKIPAKQWYVQACGRLGSDLNAILTLVLNASAAPKYCLIFERLSEQPGPITGTLRLRVMIRNAINLSFFFYALYVFSVVYKIYFNWDFYTNSEFSCGVMDFPFVIFVLLETTSMLFPVTEMIINAALCISMSYKYEYLSQKVSLTIKDFRNYSNKTIISDSSHNLFNQKLRNLAISYKKLNGILKNINSCIGFPVLVSATCSLFSVIYNLYRLFTPTKNATVPQTISFVLATIATFLKLLGLMCFGRIISSSSQKPLQSLLCPNVVFLPCELQQKVQLLFLQWKESKGCLSACGVICLGPWLMAPAIGNIITYLLIALQFGGISTNGSKYGNATIIIMESLA